MDINSLLKIFKSVDTNNDSVISEQELKNSNIKGSVWENWLQPDMSLEYFVVHGLTLEHEGEENKSENISQSSFDKVHSKLVSQGIQPCWYNEKNGIMYYQNCISLCTKNIETYDDIPDAPTQGVKSAKGADISKLRLTDEQLLNLVIDDYTTMSDEQRAVFEKYRHNMDKMGCGIESLHEKGYTGYGAVALLDGKYCSHDMYKDKIQSSTDIGTNIDSKEGPSWHTAAMLSIMHKTAPDAEIVHYCCTDMDPKIQTNQLAEAINDIIEKNKDLPDEKKVRTIVIGYGFSPENPNYEENIALCKKAIDEGIFICSNNMEQLYGIELNGADRDAKGDVNSPQSYSVATWMSENECKNVKKKWLDKLLHFPMQHLTIAHGDGQSIQYEGSDGGICWGNSVGSLYNDFLSINPDLKPQEFIDLLIETSDDLNVNGVYCGRLLNAESAMQKLEEVEN